MTRGPDMAHKLSDFFFLCKIVPAITSTLALTCW